MRRICCFCETWESGGIEAFLSGILRHMDRRGLEIDIAARHLRRSVFTGELEERGIGFREIGGVRSFRALIRERRYDVIHFNLFQGFSLRYAAAAKREGVPVRIAHSHNTALRKSATRRLKLLVHEGSKRVWSGAATDCWACSRAAAEFLFPPGLLKRKGYEFIPNGIDTERFRFDPAARRAVREELGCGDALVIGNIGRLCYQKNQDFLLDAYAEVRKRRADAVLLLIGEGEDRGALEEKAARLKLPVNFYGTTKQVERLLWAMDVFALPSRFEGLPVSLIEAQAAGLPVVCSSRITTEAYLTEQVKDLPLEDGPGAWADRLLRAHCGERGSYAEQVRAAGFDVKDAARRIETKWKDGSDGKDFGDRAGLQGGAVPAQMPGQHCGPDVPES